MELIASSENAHATGNTNKHWRHTEITSDSIPLSSAWNIPCDAILKLSLIHISCTRSLKRLP